MDLSPARTLEERPVTIDRSIPSARGLGVGCAATIALAALPLTGQAQAGGGASVPILPMSRYTLPSQTASVMLPDGWQVVATGLVLIRAQGPKGEIGIFGVVVPAQDAPAAPIAPPSPLNQPYATDLAQKFAQSIAWVRQSNHQPAVQVSFAGAVQPLSAPAMFGACGKMPVTLTVPGMGALLAEADFCSMPADSSGSYRNFFKVVAAPQQVAIAERGTLEAMMASYQLNLPVIEQQLAAQGIAMPGAGTAGAADPAAGASSAGGDTSAADAAAAAAAPAAPGASSPAARSTQAAATPQARPGKTPARKAAIDRLAAATGITPDMIKTLRTQAAQFAGKKVGETVNTYAPGALDVIQSMLQSGQLFNKDKMQGSAPAAAIANHPLFGILAN